MSLEKTTTPEGLRVYVDTIPTAETAKINGFVGVGSVHEMDKLAGISHALEHCVHLSTESFPDEQTLNEFTGINSLIANASTGYNSTSYYASGPEIEPNMKRLGEMLFRATFNPAFIPNEMLTITREGYELRDTIDSLHDIASDCALFGKPYGRNIGGYADKIQFTPEQLQEFYRRHYIASNMAIVAVGNVRIEEVLRHIERYFDQSLQEKSPMRLPEPKHSGAKSTGLLSGTSSATIKVASPMEPSFVEQYLANKPAYEAAIQALSDLCFSRFRTDTGISYDGNASLHDFNEPTAWSIAGNATIDPGKIKKARSIFKDVLSRANDSYSQTAIASAIGGTKAWILSQMDSIEDRTDLYVQNLEHNVEPTDLQNVVNAVRNLSHESVRDAIDKIVEHVGKHPPTAHITGPHQAVRSVDRLFETDELA